MPVGEIDPKITDTAAIAAAAIKLRDTGEQDWNSYVRLEVENACESCVANLAAIRDIVEKAPPKTFDLTKPLATLIAEGGITELRIIGDTVKVRTSEGWQVGVTQASAGAKEAEEAGKVG